MIAACRRARSRLLAGLSLVLFGAACGGGGGGGSPFPVAVDLASVEPSPTQAARGSGAGDFAADYLRRTNFTSLVIEVDYPASRPPTPAALQLLEQRMAERCDKPDGVTVVVDDAIPDDQFTGILDVGDLDSIERAWRDRYSDLATGTAVMYFLYVKGRSDLGGGGTDILGLTYHGSSVAFFVDAANQGSALQVTTAEVEATGIVHEAGHLLGLTGETVPMLVDHRDPTHGPHDSDPGSVMYWIVNVPLTSPNLGDPDFADFDANSVADLQAFGGLGPVPLHVGTTSVASAAPVERIAVGACAHCAALAAAATSSGCSRP